MLSPMTTTRTTSTTPHNNIILECGTPLRRVDEAVALEGGMLHLRACQCGVLTYAVEVPRLFIFLVVFSLRF